MQSVEQWPTNKNMIRVIMFNPRLTGVYPIRHNATDWGGGYLEPFPSYLKKYWFDFKNSNNV